MSSSFKHLLSPGRIGSLEMRNRIVMSPMGSNLAEADGHVGERIIRYLKVTAGRFESGSILRWQIPA